ncbi:hypothetical protein SESBI_36366 [Sesbania bispinosa]|nr:hypothetical protein SESBI_36366 [Sesbania bispinosa]
MMDSETRGAGTSEEGSGVTRKTHEGDRRNVRKVIAAAYRGEIYEWAEREQRATKLEIPLFSGDDAYGWVFRVERYFQLKGVLEHEKLGVVRVVMEGKALPCKKTWEKEALKIKNQVDREDSIDEEAKPEFVHEGTRAKSRKTSTEMVKCLSPKLSVPALWVKYKGKKDNKPHVGIAAGLRSNGKWEEKDGRACNFFGRLGQAQISRRKWGAVKGNNFWGLMGQTQLSEEVVYQWTRPYGFSARCLSKNLEDGLGEAFKGSWQQEGLREFSFDPGGIGFQQLLAVHLEGKVNV